ncbi:MAG: type II secretion system protein [Planctomycetes bacterium]|nr:type II secretion system protein [Planctomycetota bacterium]
MRRAFTLIEMLVVVAIIAILASLLSPSLQKALRTSRSLSCLNNLKQLGIWGMGYANDWNGVLPIHNDGTEGSYAFAYSWVKVARLDGIAHDKDLRAGTGLTCPALYAAHGAQFGNAAYASYGLNAFMGGAKVANRALPTVNLLSSRCYWFTDGRLFARGSGLDSHPKAQLNVWQYGPSGCKAGDGPWCWAAPDEAINGIVINSGNGHKGQQDANFLFGDGHVRNVPYLELYGKTEKERNVFNRNY